MRKSKKKLNSRRKGSPNKRPAKGAPPKKRTGTGRRSVFLPIALERKIWALLRERKPRAVSMKQLAEQLLLSRSDTRKVRSYMQEQVALGNLQGFRGSRFALLHDRDLEHPEMVIGRLKVYANGSGNVRDAEGKDYRIPENGIGAALHQDEVEIRQTHFGWKVEEVKVPFSGRLVGKLLHTMHTSYFLAEGDNYPWLELDPAQVDELDNESWITVDLKRDPESFEPIVEFVRVLEKQDGPGFDKERSMSLLGINEFPEDVVEEAERVAKLPDASETAHRLDVRDIPLVTIDGPDARDFDDAVALLEREDGVKRLIVAIADVAHYVRPETPLDLEAGRRGTSVYFPAHCIPMLPEALSNGICSLRPDEERLCMLVFMDFRDNKLIQSRVYEGLMKSHARLTYQQVADVLENEEVEEDNPALPFKAMLKNLETLTRDLRSKRMERGSLDFDIPEPKVVFDEEGEIIDIRQAERRFSHKLIEECMLQANEAMARYLLKHDIPGVYRVHGDPDRTKLRELLDLVGRFGIRTKLTEVLDRADEEADEDSKEWVIDPRQLKGLFKALEGHELQQMFQQQLLRSMMQAAYQPENLGHFGLALTHYLHFTSPIRRYPDLCVHRTLKMYLQEELPSGAAREELEQWLEEKSISSSQREREAMKAERDVMARYKARLMVHRLGEKFDGIVTGIISAGFFVQLQEPFVDGFVHVRELDGRFEYDEERLCLRNARSGVSFQLGEHVQVVVLNASPSRGSVDFGFVAFSEDVTTEDEDSSSEDA